MPGQLQTPLHRSPVLLVLLMLLMLLMLSWLPSGGALSLAQDQLPALPGPSNVHSSLDISRFRELQKRYEDFLTRLRANQTWEDWNPDLITAPQSLRASVEDLGWADWVVAPRELDVRMCIGACPSHFRSANTHAQMQARLHGLNPDAAPAPCCVPASYEPVVLMHRDSEGSVSLTPFDDLVAKDCHCV
ncbi:Growth/differentiation factor 15 [Camelus dromedarius]|uniref:Growth/differentiation factor 15 n=1 Tax=Camelus dromedarius TaxID=9838 RepID=A0A5N4CMH8_CAMDR|nr:Growth/differentiation factor 15 [Camelus dromedarius]